MTHPYQQVFFGLFLAAASSATPALADNRGFDTGPNPADLSIFRACERVAETRILDPHEASDCSIVFQRIKLSFVPGIDFEEFVTLSASDRVMINHRGYRSYLAWSQANASLFERLKPATGIESAGQLLPKAK